MQVMTAQATAMQKAAEAQIEQMAMQQKKEEVPKQPKSISKKSRQL